MGTKMMIYEIVLVLFPLTVFKHMLLSARVLCARHPPNLLTLFSSLVTLSPCGDGQQAGVAEREADPNFVHLVLVFAFTGRDGEIAERQAHWLSR